MKLSNCLIFAAREAIKNGQYIVIRKTKQEHNFPFCKYHFLVVPPEIVEKYAKSYVPKEKALGTWPCPLFDGYVKDGN